jgi:nucleoid DNA-binding protein
MKRKSLGKSAIISDVMAKGVTARKATKAVNAVFDFMKQGLWWGEPVEVPGGTLQAKVRKGRSRRKVQKFLNIQTGMIDLQIGLFPGRRRVLKYTPDLDLDLTPLPPPPAPETPEQVEARQLASELLGKPADRAGIATQKAVEVHPSKPGALLRRLREFKDRGMHFGDVTALAYDVSACYWR